jgi:biotin carboxyl carrier protein
VTEGQPLILLEAMKMELQITAPQDGIVSALDVTAGQTVERDQLLATVN